VSIKGFVEKIGEKGSLLGVDHGTKLIGLSLSDPIREFVFPAGTIQNKNAESSAIEIAGLIQEKSILGVVIGYPLQLNMQEGEQCKVIKKFVEVLQQKISIPVFFQDERLSTKGAHTMLRELNLTRKQRDKKDDELAACNILQTTLSLLKNQ